MPQQIEQTAPVQILTAGLMAVELKEPVHRVTHILATRADIKPRALAGRTRLYDRHALARVRHELAAIDAKRRCDG